MADYYAILNRTISGLGQNTDIVRDAVYTRARAAIDRQLRAMDPAPSEEAIARQMQMLDEAIAKIEAEHGPTDGEKASEAQTEPVITTQKPSSAQVSTQASPPVEARTSEPDTPLVQSPGDSTPSNLAAQSSPVSEPVVAVDTPGAGKPGAAPTIDDPRGMDYNDTILATDPNVAHAGEAKSGGGFFSALLPIIVGLAVVGGGLYAMWINKDALMEAVLGEGSSPVIEESGSPSGSQEEKQPEEKSADTPQAPDSATDEPRDNVRVVGSEPVKKTESKLTPQGLTVEPEPSESAVTPAIEPASEPVEQATAEPDTSVAEPAANDAEPQVSEVAPADTDPQTTTPATTTPEVENGGAPVAQSAFLYEEGSAGSEASRDNAAIIWSLGKEAGTNGVEEAVIKGKLDIPSRGINMTLNLKRNLDESLPASHIIEIQFVVPSEFSGGNISSVARFVMKSSEQARGEGLVAVPAKINDGYFLIALNNLEQAIQTNRKLLLESSWIDIPLGYTTGRRALITLEKGALGTKVFKDAFADWDSR